MAAERKCNIAFCEGSDKCVVRVMMREAPDVSDLRNTFNNIAPNCLDANGPDLIKLYNQRLIELQSGSVSASNGDL